MGNHRNLGLHLVFVCAFLFATTHTCYGAGNVNVVCSQKERLALLKFKHSVKDFSGMLSSWVGNDCCLWEGILCDNITGTVESLHLNDLVGNEVTSSLAELRHLKYLDFSGNDFGGSRVPKFIGSFKQLSYLNLSNVGFRGIIPPHIGNLSNLKVLDLSSNYELIADDMAWVFGLSLLEHLDLSRMKLSGAQNLDIVPYIMIPSLKELSLSECGLSNADFLNSSRIIPNIKYLDLSFNSFKGPLPGFLQNMTSLAFLDLSYFDLSLEWNFAKLLNTIPSLFELHLSHCGLDKTFLSSSFLNFSTLSNIQHLDLSVNSIEGIFPSILTNMSSLKVLDLSGNNLNALVPVMPNLLELDLSRNQLKQIQHLGIWKQCHLKELSASYNHFEIEMIDSPKNVCSQYALEMLDIHGSINGTIPESLGRLANLRVLDLSSSGLTGPIPRSLRRLSFLEVLDLSNNQLTGHIPSFLGKLTALTNLNLSSNKLVGEIPVDLTALSMLVGLNLSNNHLSGRIPDRIGNMIALFSLDLSGNELMGMIPPSMAALTFLSHLNLSHNKLSGRIPTGNQLQTLTDPSIFAGNEGLCGPPLPKNCSNQEVPKTTSQKKKEKAADEATKVWLFYLDVICGFATGFWGVIGLLLFKKQLRHKLFLFAEETMDKIYVAVVVRVAKMKRQREDA